MQMLRSNSRHTIFTIPLVYTVVASIGVAIGYAFEEILEVDSKKVVHSSIFLCVLYLLMYSAFLFFLKSNRELLTLSIVSLMGIKFMLALGFVFLFLEPTCEEYHREILLFFKTYFALLIADIAIKMKLMKN